MRIAIVDDNEEDRKYLTKEITEIFREKTKENPQITQLSSGEEFVKVLSVSEPGEFFDIVFLDIYMKELTGIDTAKKLRQIDKVAKIIFITTSNEFASESYEVNACYYLRKPFGRDKVKVMLDRLNLAEIEKMRTVKLPDGTSAILRNIIYVDFSSHRVTLHCKYDVDTIVRTSFSEIESLLCAYPYFSSPTKGMLINFYEVASQTNDVFIMSDGKSIPISRRKSKEVLDAYFTFRFEMLRNGGGK